MIGKHLSSAGSNRAGVVARYTSAGGVSNLCNYIVNGTQRVESKKEVYKDKVLFWGSANFNFDEYNAQVSEMMATTGAAIAKAKRASKPVEHYVFSYRSNEKPTQQQIVEVVNTFVKDAGMEKHQYIWGVHGNTENIHVHIALSRVDPTSLEIKRINNGFDKILCQKVSAKMEALQGFEQLEGNIFKYNKDTQTFTDKRKEQSTIEQKIQIKKDKESLKERARQELTKIFKNSISWQELHDGLRECGAFVAPRRGGAVIRYTGVEGDIKASDIHRDFSMSSLKKRFGYFKEDSNRHSTTITQKENAMNIIEKMTKNGVDRETLSNSRTVWAMREYFGKNATEASIYKKIENDAKAHGMKVEQAQMMEMSQVVYGALHQQKEEYRQQKQEQELAQRAPRDTLELLLMLALALFGLRMATQYELEAQQEAERQALLEDAERQGLAPELIERMVEEQAKRHQQERERLNMNMDTPASPTTAPEPEKENEWAPVGMRWEDVYSAAATRAKMAAASEGGEAPQGNELDRLVAARLMAMGYTSPHTTMVVAAGIMTRESIMGQAQAQDAARVVVESVPCTQLDAMRPRAELWKVQERQDTIMAHTRYERQGITVPAAVRAQVEAAKLEMDSGPTMQ